MQPTDYTDLLIRYETEGLTEEEHIDLFQHLIDTGAAWGLQGSYGREAAFLIEQGLCHAKEKV